jgi:hypothetical protein
MQVGYTYSIAFMNPITGIVESQTSTLSVDTLSSGISYPGVYAIYKTQT